jgi:hypothetical protein
MRIGVGLISSKPTPISTQESEIRNQESPLRFENRLERFSLLSIFNGFVDLIERIEF